MKVHIYVLLLCNSFQTRILSSNVHTVWDFHLNFVLLSMLQPSSMFANILPFTETRNVLFELPAKFSATHFNTISSLEYERLCKMKKPRLTSSPGTLTSFLQAPTPQCTKRSSLSPSYTLYQEIEGRGEPLTSYWKVKWDPSTTECSDFGKKTKVGFLMATNEKKNASYHLDLNCYSFLVFMAGSIRPM